MKVDPCGVAETATLEAAVPASTTGAYLLVIEAGSATTVPLQSPGSLTIGRATDLDLQLDHASVSRYHARITVDGAEVRIADLGSHNGTRVDGEAVLGERTLTNGETVTIGEVVVVVYAPPRRELPHVVLETADWRRWLMQEVERAIIFGRSLAVLTIAATSAELGTALRAIDVVGRDDGGHLIALLPEADPKSALELAGVALRAVCATTPDARVGVALCPSDATDADSLIWVARAALRSAGPGAIGRAADIAERRALGDREVLVSHPAMARVFDLLKRLAASNLPVLLIGETGVGKENAAYAVHHYSSRVGRPFVALNCAALPESLVESQLFGHDRGAFTGASSAHAGVFEAASGGTLFLDELGELPLSVQAKLLRVLESQRVTRLGETREREVDVRVVAATNRMLDKEVTAGKFRQDLYFRLAAARVHLPPLRDRRCEIPILFRDFVAAAARRQGREPPEPTPQVIQQLLAYAWPGNVRELKHVAEFLTATTDDDRFEPTDLPPEFAVTPQAAVRSRPAGEQAAPMRRLVDELEEIERQRMAEALVKAGRVKTRAAALLGMPIRTFNMKCKQYGL